MLLNVDFSDYGILNLPKPSLKDHYGLVAF